MPKTSTGQEEMLFRFAESQFYRMVGKVDRKKTIEVLQVDCYHNPRLIERFEHTQSRFKHKGFPDSHLAFHGTWEVNIDSIMRQGLKIGGESVDMAHADNFGRGVYTAMDPAICHRFSGGEVTNMNFINAFAYVFAYVGVLAHIR